MCAIVGSADTRRFQDLWEINAYRGVKSHSFGLFDPTQRRFTSLAREEGALKGESAQIPPGLYGLGHCQTPTSPTTWYSGHIHPAEKEGALLWHNGLIKAGRLNELRTRLNVESTWDTQLLLDFILQGNNLSEIDGSFACALFKDGALFIFRNELCRLHYDPTNLDLSSAPFPRGELIPPNVFLTLDFGSTGLVSGKRFGTKENPYLL